MEVTPNFIMEHTEFQPCEFYGLIKKKCKKVSVRPLQSFAFIRDFFCVVYLFYFFLFCFHFQIFLLQDIRFDLEKNQPRVMSLRDTADQLLINSDSPEMSNAKDKMHIIANRLKALLRLCSSYISSLETRLDTKPVSVSFIRKGSSVSNYVGSRGQICVRLSC